MPVTKSEAPRTCPECDGWGILRVPGNYGSRCRCCKGSGNATRAQIQAYDRLLDAENEAAARELAKVSPQIDPQPDGTASDGFHPFSGLVGGY